MTATNYAVTTDSSLVTLLLPEQRGAVRMTPEAAVYLAQQLLDAAHKVQPGCAGIMIGGHRA